MNKTELNNLFKENEKITITTNDGFEISITEIENRWQNIKHYRIYEHAFGMSKSIRDIDAVVDYINDHKKHAIQLELQAEELSMLNRMGYDNPYDFACGLTSIQKKLY